MTPDQLLLSLTDEELTSIAIRLLNGADIPRNPDGTYDLSLPWLWKGQTDKDGYGIISVKHVKVRAHRLAFYLLHRYLPPVVRHEEPIPNDINPYRLLAGTQKENAADRARHGNTASGARNGRSKLTPEKVRAIRRAADRGAVQAELARHHSVDPTTIRDIVRGRIWKHV